MANLFDETVDQPEIDPEKDYFSELVGEDKKYKDNVAAGRALVEKDVHITKIEKENALMREELNKRATVEELMDKINTSRQAVPQTTDNQESTEEGQTPPTQKTVSDPQPKVEDVVHREIEKARRADREAANLQSVVDVLTKNYGKGFQAVLTQKAEELGVGQKFLDDLAKTQPKAFFQLIGVSETPAKTVNPVPSTRANPGTARSDGRKNFNYFETLRKQNPSGFLTEAQNKEMMKLALEMGDDFYR